jgi:hypothetical protein
LYTSPDITRVIKSRRNEIGYACSTHGKDEKYRIFWLGNLKGRDHPEDLGVDGKIILDWILLI